jgi:hypothetical protein
LASERVHPPPLRMPIDSSAVERPVSWSERAAGSAWNQRIGGAHSEAWSWRQSWAERWWIDELEKMLDGRLMTWCPPTTAQREARRELRRRPPVQVGVRAEEAEVQAQLEATASGGNMGLRADEGAAAPASSLWARKEHQQRSGAVASARRRSTRSSTPPRERARRSSPQGK